MNFHTNQTVIKVPVPQFATRNGNLIMPEKIYTKREYPNFPEDMVKIIGQNGQRIFIKRSKISPVEVDM